MKNRKEKEELRTLDVDDKETKEIAKHNPLEEFYKNKRVAVPGGTGFLGRHVVTLLKDLGAVVQSPSRGTYNLLSDEQTNCFFAGFRPNYVINLAGYNGNVQFNQEHSFDLLYNNLLMELNVLKNCSKWNVEKVCSIISACAYPNVEVETSEDMLWYGECDESIKWHGHARRLYDTLSQGYAKQYNNNSITLTLTTMFGPGDSFNPERTKLMGGIIRRVVEAKQSSSPSISCWGTGEVLRQVLYVKDAAKMILEAFMNYNDSSETLNITNPTEFTVAELVDLVVDVVGYEGEVQWDTTKPSGQARRWLSSNKMNQSVTHPVTDMRVAVTETVGWYLDNKAKADARL